MMMMMRERERGERELIDSRCLQNGFFLILNGWQNIEYFLWPSYRILYYFVCCYFG